jgi:hypothetical protein
LVQRRRDELVPVTARSIALFRLGEVCNDRCPMCSNSGRPDAWLIDASELRARADFLWGEGIRRVVLTGGEPTLHPGFWPLVAHLNHLGVVWDLNTHGRAFAEPGFARRAVEQGLQRAILSFHSHRPEVGRVMFGVAKAHEETVLGIKALRETPVELTLNCVLSRMNHAELGDYIDWCADRFGTGYRVKLVFPFTGGKGGRWEGIQLSYREVLPGLTAARGRARARGIPLDFESFPNCLLGLAQNQNLSRTGFGETHYLEDIEGRTLYSMAHLEAFFQGYAETPCGACRARPSCPGVAFSYLRAQGVGELVPFE